VGNGLNPQWNGDGTRLYFITGDRLMEVGVTMAPTVSISAPRPLFSGPQAGAVFSGAFPAMPAPDGSRFLLSRSSSPTESTAVNIVQFAEFAGAARSR
jgi:hypothetical protein